MSKLINFFFLIILFSCLLQNLSYAVENASDVSNKDNIKSDTAMDSTIEYTPASFGNTENSLQKILGFPSSDEDMDVVINCDAYLSKNGVIVGNFCFIGDNAYIRYVNIINRAARKARLIPATINKQRRPIWFQYTVEFIKQGELKIIHVYPNHGKNKELYGHNYTSPQRYIDYKWRGCTPRIGHKKNMWVAMIVNKEGKAENIEFLNDGIVSKSCSKSIIKDLKKSSFIPAFHKGKIVEAVYVEPYFFGNRRQNLDFRFPNSPEFPLSERVLQ